MSRKNLVSKRLGSALALVGIPRGQVSEPLAKLAINRSCAELELAQTRLGQWADRVYSNGLGGAKTYLNSILREFEDGD